MKRHAQVIAIVDGVALDQTSWISEPVDIEEGDPEYPYAPGYTPTDLPTLPMTVLKVRVVNPIKGPLARGDEVSVRYLSDAVNGKAVSRTPADSRYLVYLTAGEGGFYDPVAGPPTIFSAGPKTRGKPAKVFVPVEANEMVTQVTTDNVG